jgi:hypothetical protein
MFERMDNKDTAENDRKVRFQVSLTLFAAIVIATLEIWRFMSGRTGGRAHLSTLVIAFCCFVAITQYKQMLLKAAFALIGIQAAIRVILSRTAVSVGWLHTANVVGQIMQLLGVIIVIFVIVDWLSSSRHENASS